MDLSAVTDKLSNLNPLGTFYLYDAPRINQESLAPDGWRWFVLPFSYSTRYYRLHDPQEPQTLSEILIVLRYLLERLHARATYKFFPVGNSSIVAVRVYAVPRDLAVESVDRVRMAYRRGKGQEWHKVKYRSLMGQLLKVLDYSLSGWNVSCLKDIFNGERNLILFPTLQPWKEFSLQMLQNGSLVDLEVFTDENYSVHMTRLKQRAGLGLQVVTPVVKVSLEARLLELYQHVDITEDVGQEILRCLKSNGELREFTESLFNNEVPGIKSSLYKYQRESVFRMVQRETEATEVVVPNMFQVEDISSISKRQHFYFDLTTNEFAVQPTLYRPARGGILAENMGLGKTCICLALVCLTKYQVAEMPKNVIEGNQKSNKLQSLTDICSQVINYNSLSWKLYKDFLPNTIIEKLTSNPGFFEVVNDKSLRCRLSLRSRPQEITRKLYLSGTTLVVVPNNLYYQWISEIRKHCIDDYLNVLYVPYHNSTIKKDYELPSPLTITQYDMVLMGVSSYVKESGVAGSPLKSVYWKRLIIDEGQSVSTKTTRLAELSRNLHVERKWLISGTPTSGLTNLHVNEELETSSLNNNIDHEAQLYRQDNSKQEYSIKRKFVAKNDLAKIGILVGNFFRLEPWASDSTLFSKTIVKPFVSSAFIALESVANLLKGLLIRHSISTVEADINLPPLVHNAVFLEPSFHNKLSINLFISVLATNAVTSERQDQDYMFHPKNRSSLKRLITNLQRLTFHWVGFSQSDIETLVSICEKALNKMKLTSTNEFYYSVQDRVKLSRCIECANLALSNKIWRVTSTMHEMLCFVSGLPLEYSKNYCVDYISQSKNISIYPYMQLNSIQKFYFKNRFLTDRQQLLTRIEEYSKKFWRGYWKTQHKKARKLAANGDAGGLDVELIKTISHDSTNKASQKMNGKKSRKRRNSYEAMIETNHAPKDISKIDITDTRKAKVLGTLSSKLTYLVSRLLDHSCNGVKSIVFYQFEDSAYYLLEMLDLLGLDYLLYSTSIPVYKRNSKLIEFKQHSGTGITLIMDIKLASRGLTIISATRMYFISPVWQKEIEAQAIKRAHRIGQTLPVHVETLILEGTLEEEMYRRRRQLEDTEESSKDVYEDHGMKDYFEHHEFLEMDVDDSEYSSFSAPAINDDKYLIDIDLLGNNKDVDTTTEEIKELYEHSYNLLKPVGYLDHDLRKWDLPLFTEAALNKINETQLKKDFMIDDQTMINSIEEETLKENVQEKRANLKTFLKQKRIQFSL